MFRVPAASASLIAVTKLSRVSPVVAPIAKSVSAVRVNGGLIPSLRIISSPTAG